ncbi:S-layer homology domain-containing protein [Anaerovorax odorimutans]|uniref:S-layer homology domain-containing protein n=1 Tax=Anaerovorax odorimutans TaxID=109327 RepID=UPI00146D4A73|nr:S-layer homology domain-containing protein [Anaerovorax odorimutans]
MTVSFDSLEIRYGFLADTVTYYGGGGLELTNGDITISNCYIHDNKASKIGFGVDSENSKVTLTINDSVISENSSSDSVASNDRGGGIYTAGQTTITDSTISNNSGVSKGAGIHVDGSTSFIMTNCTVANNSSDQYGGGLYLDKSMSIMTNCTIAYNSAVKNGGGISIELGTLNIKNTIAAGNSAKNNVNSNDFDHFSGDITDNGYNIIEYHNSSSFTGTGDKLGEQTSLGLSTELADNGGSTKTLALQSGSVAINAGDGGMNGSVSVPSTDQRGLSRDTQIDIGAYEYIASSATAPTVTTQPVSSIGTTTATGNGNITSLGVPNPTAHGVCWNTTGNPTTADSKTDEGAAAAAGAFTTSITGLTANTTYYVRAYAINSAGTSYGSQVSFTTSVTAPTVTTQNVSSIGTTTATGNGNITNLGAPNPTAHGVCWNTTGNPTTADSKTDEGAAEAAGTFTTSITGLTANTTYHVRAYAINSAGTTYGSDVTFTTLDTTAPILTAGAVTRTNDTQGTVKFTSNEVGSYYYKVVADGATAPTIDTSGVGTACTTDETTISNPTGLTVGAKDIYIKVKDAEGNVSNALKIDIAAYMAPDNTAPSLTAGEVKRTSDTEGIVKFTSNEAGSYYYAIVADGASEPTIDTSGTGTACTTDETTISNPTGLTTGAKDIYIKVKDADGNVSNALKIDIATYTSSGGSSGGSSKHRSSTNTTKQSQQSVPVIVNGKEQNAGKKINTTEDGKTTVTVKVDNKAIESKINEVIKNDISVTDNVIQIPVSDTKSQVAKVELTGDIVKKLEQETFDVSIKRENIEYVIPAQEFTISKVAENLDVTEKDLEDIKVEVKITKLDQKLVEKYNEVAKVNGAELVFSPVEFEIVAKTTKTDGTVQEQSISKFSNYVERVMEIPASVDPNQVTTGIVFNPDGTYSHVPTKVYQKDGTWYAKLKSLTNSDYSIIWNPVTVKSVENHWAKDAVNDLASRLIIFNSEEFKPNKAITRADFAEYIVRALGLYREGSTHENKFTDVSSTGERTLAILIANEYGIISGYSDETFRGDTKITREEAMTMYQRAMKLTALKGNDTTKYQNYTDFSNVSGWAGTYVKEVLAAHVFNGTSATNISPKANLTYAEAAQAVKNLLVESELINK